MWGDRREYVLHLQGSRKNMLGYCRALHTGDAVRFGCDSFWWFLHAWCGNQPVYRHHSRFSTLPSRRYWFLLCFFWPSQLLPAQQLWNSGWPYPHRLCQTQQSLNWKPPKKCITPRHRSSTPHTRAVHLKARPLRSLSEVPTQTVPHCHVFSLLSSSTKVQVTMSSVTRGPIANIESVPHPIWRWYFVSQSHSQYISVPYILAAPSALLVFHPWILMPNSFTPASSSSPSKYDMPPNLFDFPFWPPTFRVPLLQWLAWDDLGGSGGYRCLWNQVVFTQFESSPCLEFLNIFDLKLRCWKPFSRMRSKGSRFTLGVWGLRVCSLDDAFTCGANHLVEWQMAAAKRGRKTWPGNALRKLRGNIGELE